VISATSVTISTDINGPLHGELVVPPDAMGIVVFAHGSGSSRSSPRNRFVADRLQRASLATLMTDLLTAEEEYVDRRVGEFRFDIDLLARRLEQIIDWTSRQTGLASTPLGLFGASTGAAAALVAAAHRPERVGAVVSRGGRPDLAGPKLADVRAPTLLIVGGNDKRVLELNNEAARTLTAECGVNVVKGATHLFEEPGALDRVAELAAEWFTRHLTPGLDRASVTSKNFREVGRRSRSERA
jgi:dienelactone hydrolase